MSNSVGEHLISKDSVYSSQYSKLEKLQERLALVEEEYNADMSAIRCKTFADKTPIFNELREVYKTLGSFWSMALANIPIFCKKICCSNMLTSF